jgi:hypothetical protein
MSKQYEHRLSLGKGDDDEDDDDGIVIDFEKDEPPAKPDQDIEILDEEEDEPPPAKPDKDEPPSKNEPPPKSDPEVAELRARLEQVTQHLNQQREAAQRGYMEYEDRQLEDKEKQAKAKFKAAQEAGDPDQAAEAVAEIGEIKAERRARQFARQQPPADQPEAPPARPANPLTQRWLSLNQWYGDKNHEEETLIAQLVDRKMAAEGWRPNQEGYFEEMNKRISEKVRTIQPVGLRQTSKPPPLGGAKPVKQKLRPGVVRLTRDDLKMMATVGLDPESKEDRVAYAKQKQQYGE